MTKNKCQNMHFKQRVRERYGLEINSHDRFDMLRQVQSGRATFVDKQSLSRTIFIVNVKNTDIKVVYDKTRKTFRTALPFNEEIDWDKVMDD